MMISKTISVGTRKVKANITREMIEDIKAYHGIDIEAELDAILRSEINDIKSRKEKIEDLINDSIS